MQARAVLTHCSRFSLNLLEHTDRSMTMADDKKIEVWGVFNAEGRLKLAHMGEHGELNARKCASNREGWTVRPLIVDPDYVEPWTPPKGAPEVLPEPYEWEGRTDYVMPGEHYWDGDRISMWSAGYTVSTHRKHPIVRIKRSPDPEARKLLEQASDALLDYRMSLYDGAKLEPSSRECEKKIDDYLDAIDKRGQPPKWDQALAEVAGVEEAKRQEAQQPQPDAATVLCVLKMIANAAKKHATELHSGRVEILDSEVDSGAVRVGSFNGSSFRNVTIDSEYEVEEAAEWIVANQPGGDK